MQGLGNLIDGAKKMVQNFRSPNNASLTNPSKNSNLKFPNIPDIEKKEKVKIETTPIIEK